MTYTAYRLRKPILDFKEGYIMTADEKMGYLGKLPWGWEIPIEIIKRNPEWFEKVTK